jgi:uncharacterized membrane protein
MVTAWGLADLLSAKSPAAKEVPSHIEESAMKLVSACVGTFLLVGLAGCQRSEPAGGGSDRAHQFTVSGPSMRTSIRRGDTQTVTLKLNRGKDFKENVTLKAEPPTGVEAVLSQTTVKPDDKGEVSLKITATDSASLGDHDVRVSAKPGTGSATAVEVPIKVEERAEAVKLSLSGPLTTTKIKQGDTETISLTLKHVDRLNGSAKMQAVPGDKGVTAEFTNPTVKSSDSGTLSLKVTADRNATPGEYTIHVTGTPDNNNITITPLDVKVKVVER